MITVAVTGSNGFIGSNFVDAARGRFNIRLIGRNIAHPDLPNAQASLDDEDRLAEVLSGCDAIVHCAHTGTDESENVLWAINLVRAAKRAGVKQMIAFGSFATYDNQSDVITHSTPALAAKIPYVVEKIRLESALNDLLKTEYPALHLYFLQPTIVVGNGGSWDRFARRLQRTRRIYLPNKGNAVCNIVSVEKVVDAVCRSLEAAPDFYRQGSMRKLLIAGDSPTTWARWLAEGYGIPASKIETCNGNSWAESTKRNVILSLQYSLLGSVLSYLKQLKKKPSKSSHSPRSSLAQIAVASENHEVFIPEGLDRLTFSCKAVVQGDLLP